MLIPDSSRHGHVICRSCNEFVKETYRRVEGVCKRCWERHYFMFDEGALSPDRETQRYTAKLKTMSASWLHHPIYYGQCNQSFHKCPRAEAHRFGDWAKPTIVAH